MSVSRRAWLVLAGAAITIVTGGTLFAATQHVSWFTGEYWAMATATTVGYGDITAHNTIGRILTIIVMMTAIPSLAACFALMTSEHLVKRGLGWWTQHGILHVRDEAEKANTALHEALHQKLEDLHTVMGELQETVGNGFLTGVQQQLSDVETALHTRLDGIESAVIALPTEKET